MAHQSTALDELMSRLMGLQPEQLHQFEADIMEATGNMIWVPQPGPQTEAYFSEADELFYGGEAGGGKTDLLVGLSLTAHIRSLLLRRTNKEATKLPDRYEEILGTLESFNGSSGVLRYDNRIIDLGGCQLEKDKQKRKGIAHDLKAFDEISDFTESQFRFICTWNRTTVPGQRCRIVCAGNPPTDAEGYWVMQYWGPWLDPTHPNPAKSGELRWFVVDERGKDKEVDGKGPHLIGGKPVFATSRTFIRAKVTDNNYQSEDYIRRLDALTGVERMAFRDGRFDLAMRDKEAQVVPTQWILEAQKRWTEQPPAGIPMCAVGCDVTGGGHDETVLAPRHDGWYAPLVVIPGEETPYGQGIGGRIISLRRDNARIIIDMGGGYGNLPYSELEKNGIDPVAYKGGSGATMRAAVTNYSFANLRSQTIWKFREALDPTQPGGSPIMLPPDPQLVSDLAAPTYKNVNNVIHVERKEDVVARLGRSPDKGDSVVMAWHDGPKMMDSYDQWQQNSGGGYRQTQVQTGHANRKRRR